MIRNFLTFLVVHAHVNTPCITIPLPLVIVNGSVHQRGLLLYIFLVTFIFWLVNKLWKEHWLLLKYPSCILQLFSDCFYTSFSMISARSFSNILCSIAHVPNTDAFLLKLLSTVAKANPPNLYCTSRYISILSLLTIVIQPLYQSIKHHSLGGISVSCDVHWIPPTTRIITGRKIAQRILLMI